MARPAGQHVRSRNERGEPGPGDDRPAGLFLPDPGSVPGWLPAVDDWTHMVAGVATHAQSDRWVGASEARQAPGRPGARREFRGSEPPRPGRFVRRRDMCVLVLAVFPMDGRTSYSIHLRRAGVATSGQLLRPKRAHSEDAVSGTRTIGVHAAVMGRKRGWTDGIERRYGDARLGTPGRGCRVHAAPTGVPPLLLRRQRGFCVIPPEQPAGLV